MVNQWEIRFCILDPTKGSEQRGTRPVLVVSNDSVNRHLRVSTVLPLTSLKPGDRAFPTEVLLPASKTGLPKDSLAMAQQVRTVSHERLDEPVGSLGDEGLREEVRETLRRYFDL